MKKTQFIFLLLFTIPLSAQIKYPFKSFSEFKSKLDSVCNISDEVKRAYAVVDLFDTLSAHKKIPFTFKDTVALTYRGAASSVSWGGDFNGWDPTVGNFNGTKVGLSNVWLCIKTFPTKARLDYKIVVGSNWITDPENPYKQYSGVGTTNSELRMPEWIYPQETLYRQDVPAGNFSDNFSINSTKLGYTVYYKVYTPAGYEKLNDLPAIYVTDGHEYSDDRLGSMVNVLNNMIFEKRIKPIIAVFIDPRSVPNSGGTNRRGSEYTLNQNYADFVCDELVPIIDTAYKTDKNADNRAILGTSLGGLNSAYFGVYRPDKFRLIGIHSPAFQANKQIYEMFSNAAKLPLKIFMSAGTIYDTQANALQLKSILDSKGYPLMYIEVPEGHSWGNWRALLDEPLIYFFKNDNSTGLKTNNSIPTKIELGNYPNPFNPATKIWFTLSRPETITLQIFNSLGQKVDTLVRNKFYESGNHSILLNASSLTSGVYFCILSGNTFQKVNKLQFIK